MPRAQTSSPPALPALESSLYAITVDQLQWYVGALPESAPTRKGDLVALLVGVLRDDDRIRLHQVR